jgi:hypothetical protein
MGTLTTLAPHFAAMIYYRKTLSSNGPKLTAVQIFAQKLN